MRAVCQALGVSRSHVLAKKDRAPDWTDQRKSPPQCDDAQVKQAIADVVQMRATYGYRRVWARLRLDGHIGINHKRVYRVMRDARCVAHTAGIEGLTEKESASLLSFLFEHQVKPEFTCRWSWEPDALAFWDNRCAQHNPVNDYHGFRRILHRITLQGDKPV